MDKITFLSLIEDDILTKFKSYDAILIREGFNNEFLTLHKMWNYFGKPDKEKNQETNYIQTADIKMIEPEIGSEQHGIELEKQGIELVRSNVELDMLSCNETNEESGIVLEELLEEATNEKNNIKLWRDSKNTTSGDTFVRDSKNVHIIENIVIKEKDVLTESTTLNNCINLPCKSSNIIESNLSHTLHDFSTDINIIDTKSVFLNLPSTSKTCISDYLKVPDKPQRKNKRDVERLSFAITSRCYQKSFESKRALKLEEDNKKMERKRLREEKAAAKTNSENKRVCKLKEAVNNANYCFVCKKRLTKSSQYLSCDDCKNHVHRLCIPNAHKKHIPDLEDDDDLFLCHKCYKEESDEEVGSEESIIVNENEGKENIFERSGNEDPMGKLTVTTKQEIDEDEREIDELYNIYKDQCAKYY